MVFFLKINHRLRKKQFKNDLRNRPGRFGQSLGQCQRPLSNEPYVFFLRNHMEKMDLVDFINQFGSEYQTGLKGVFGSSYSTKFGSQCHVFSFYIFEHFFLKIFQRLFQFHTTLHIHFKKFWLEPKVKFFNLKFREMSFFTLKYFLISKFQYFK